MKVNSLNMEKINNLYLPWILLLIYLNKIAVNYTKTRAEKYLDNAYSPLPDIIQGNFPNLDIKIPDKLLFLTISYTIISIIWNWDFIIVNEQLFILLSTFSIRPFFCCLTILPACMPKQEENRSLYDTLCLSTHDLMFSGHTCVFVFMGKIINGYTGYIIGYILPITLIMSKLHYSIDVFVSMFVYNYIDLFITSLNN